MSEIFKEKLKVLFSKECRIKLFAVAFSIYIAETIVFEAFYRDIQSVYLLLALIRNICYVLIILKIFLDFVNKEFTLKELIFITVVGSLLLISTIVVKNKNLLIFWVFIVGANNIELRKIVKLSLIAHIAALLFVIASAYMGVIENYITDQGTRNRQSLGFLYPTPGSHFVLYTILMWLYIRKNKIKWIEIVLAVTAAVFMYIKTDTRSPFMLSMLVILAGVILKYSEVLRRYHKCYSFIVIAAVPTACLMFFILTYKFNWDNEIIVKINNIINGRIYLAAEGFKNYGIKPFGQYIKWIGGIPGPDEVYNYVDSSYAMILINYGIIVFAMIMTWAEACSIQIAKQKDSYMVFIWSVIAVHSICDPQFSWIGFNCFLMMYMYIRREINKKKIDSAGS